MKKLLTMLFLILMVTSITFGIISRVEGKEKPRVVLFHMHGCSACMQFAPLYEKMASKYSGKFSFTKQDINKSSLANQLNITSVPVVFIINPQTQAKTKISYDCLQQQGCFEKTLLNY